MNGIKFSGWKRIDVDQESQCPEATSKHADAWPGGGKLESLATKQTQVDVAGNTPGVERGENCPFDESP